MKKLQKQRTSKGTEVAEVQVESIMEKQRQFLEASGENILSSAEKVAEILVDPTDRSQHLDDLKELALQHAKLEKDLDSKSKALEYVKQKVKGIPDLEVEKEFKVKTEAFSESATEIQEEDEVMLKSKLCQDLDKLIQASGQKIKTETEDFG